MFRKHAEKAPYGHTVYDVVYGGRIIGTVQGGSRDPAASHWWVADARPFEGEAYGQSLAYCRTRQQAADRLVVYYERQIAQGRRLR